MLIKRHFGWRRQAHDARDRRHCPPAHLLAAPPPMADISQGLGENLDQGSLGSCGPNTADECVEFDQKAQGLPVQSASRLFVYYNTRALMGTVSQDSGVDNRTMLKALAQSGFCPESQWPYDVSKFTQKPPVTCYAAAMANRITSYAAVTQSLAQMKATIAGGKPIIFGFEVFEQIESAEAARTGLVALPARGERPIGGHDVTFCGYDDATQLFKFRNHWRNADGSWWGQGGYGFIPYAYALDPQLAGDFWMINAVPGSVPVPPTPPAPPAAGKIVVDLANRRVALPAGWAAV